VAYRPPEPLERRHNLDDFDCGEPALDEWLERHARGAHAAGSARVFVTTVEDDDTVVGYYAVAAAQVAPEAATERTLKGQPRTRPVPAILLARLAVDRRHQRAEAIGARVLLVHAKHEAAKAWYLQYGFEESPTDPLHLVMLLKDVRALLQGRGADQPSKMRRSRSRDFGEPKKP
jgi:hypothetical protein